MARTMEEQAVELLKRSRLTLITTCEHPSLDEVASACALAYCLKAEGRQFDLVIPGFTTAPAFLPTEGLTIRSLVGALRAYHFKLDVSKVSLQELLYEVRDGLLDITLLPKEGSWTGQDAHFSAADDRYDLVIALGASDKQSLGELSRRETDFLSRVVTINIDCNAANEYWGQINIVDLRKSAVAEVVHAWLETWAADRLTPDVATCLLAGIVAKTRAFRTPNLQSETLERAAKLVALGGRREEVVYGIWRTRSVASLRLWGAALSRLETDPTTGLVWTYLTETDLHEANGDIDATDGVVEELIRYAPDAKAILIFFHRADSLHGRLHALGPHSAVEIARPFQATGTREIATFNVAGMFPHTQLQKTIIEQVKTRLAN
jgi:nanoRNase/pAp phosphatase (c-di-AMP/oligoRNAs hydrolase)